MYEHTRMVRHSDKWNVFKRRHLLPSSLRLQRHLTVKTWGLLIAAIKFMLLKGEYNLEAWHIKCSCVTYENPLQAHTWVLVSRWCCCCRRQGKHWETDLVTSGSLRHQTCHHKGHWGQAWKVVPLLFPPFLSPPTFVKCNQFLLPQTDPCWSSCLFCYNQHGLWPSTWSKSLHSFCWVFCQ